MTLIFTMQLGMPIILGRKQRLEKLLKNEIHCDEKYYLLVSQLLILVINFLTCTSFGRNSMSKKEKNFNVTQGMILLLLKKLSLPANLAFLMILFITNPANKIGYED